MNIDGILRKIQQCVDLRKWEITMHADKEAQEDDVSISDIKHVIKNGKIIKKLTYDPRGTRYKILGQLPDRRFLNLIVKFNSLGEVRIITVYLEEL